jgi:NAD(P)-dependent dehydrogenase (short-subunit alcohol dehydrogenase family)
VASYDGQVAAFEKAVEIFGSIDFVFANAGIAGASGFYSIADMWPPKPPSLLVQDICLTGVVYTSHLAMHYMRRNKVPGGSIIMTASGKSLSISKLPIRINSVLAASLYASPDLPLYCSSKHGVLGFMRSIHTPLAKEGIRVSCILPGAILTTLHSEETWSQFGGNNFTPIESIVKTVVGLLNDPNASGKAMEISAGEVFDRKQPDFCNETMRRIMTDNTY